MIAGKTNSPKPLGVMSGIILVSVLFLAISTIATADSPCTLTIRTSAGVVVARIAADGAVRDAGGKLLGRIRGGEVRDGHGVLLGKVDDGGAVRDRTGKLLGRVDRAGDLRDATGALLGRIDTDGDVRDRSGALKRRLAGYAPSCASIAAAYLFFFDSTNTW